MSNPGRGEKKITIGKINLVLTLSYEHIAELEELIDTGLLALAGRVAYLLPSEDRDLMLSLMSSPIKLTDIVAALWVLSGKLYSQDQIGNAILDPDVGVNSVLPGLNDFLIDAVVGAPMGESAAEDQETLEEATQ